MTRKLFVNCAEKFSRNAPEMYYKNDVAVQTKMRASSRMHKHNLFVVFSSSEKLHDQTSFRAHCQHRAFPRTSRVHKTRKNTVNRRRKN